MRRASAAAATSRFTSGVAAATTSQTPSRSAGTNAAPAIDVGTPARSMSACTLGRDDADVGAGGQQLLQLGRGDRAAADEQRRGGRSSFRKE